LDYVLSECWHVLRRHGVLVIGVLYSLTLQRAKRSRRTAKLPPWMFLYHERGGHECKTFYKEFFRFLAELV